MWPIRDPGKSLRRCCVRVDCLTITNSPRNHGAHGEKEEIAICVLFILHRVLRGTVVYSYSTRFQKGNHTKQLALLGSDEESCALARAAQSAGHELVWCGDMLPEHLAELGSPLPCRDDWELLLDAQFCDGVIVGRGAASPDERIEQLQKLIGNEIPLLISSLPVDSVLPFHELDMLRREKRCLVQRYHPEIDHPWIVQLGELCLTSDSELGAVQQIALERGMNEPHRQAIVTALARDIELLERLAGSLTSVSAIGAAGDELQLRGLSVQIIGDREIPVRWSLSPGENSRLTLTGERKKLAVELTAVNKPWRIDGKSDLLVGPVDFSAPLQAINQFTAAIAAIRSHEPAELYSTWGHATRAMEVVDVVELSLHKGRTIEVHHQKLTEDLAFRGTMSALGCALLMTVLLGLVVVGIFGDIFGVPLKRVWPLLLLAALGLFLLFQLLPKLFPPRDS